MLVADGAVRPGDLVFFMTVAPRASHVDIAINRNEFVHAPSEHGVVRIERPDRALLSESASGGQKDG